MRARGRARGPRATLPAVTARSEVPSSFRSSSVRPGSAGAHPPRHHGDAVPTASHRLPRARRPQEERRGHAAGQRLVGRRPAAPDAHLLRPGGRDPRRGGDIDAYPLFIFAAILPWKWFDVDGQATASRRSIGPGAADQADLLPEARAAARGGGVGRRQLRVRPHPAVRPDASWPTRRTRHAWLLLHPGRRPSVQLLFSMGIAIAASAVNVFYRDVGNLTRHVLRFWFYLSPDAVRPRRGREDRRQQPRDRRSGSRSTRSPTSSASYRDVIYYGTGAGLGRPARGDRWRPIVLLALAILFFKRVEPSFAKVL